MFMAMFDDMRVVLIKLADRAAQHAHPRRPPRRRSSAASPQQTIEIYAPLANRLGMWQIKSELEDLAFYYLEPEKYLELVALAPGAQRGPRPLHPARDRAVAEGAARGGHRGADQRAHQAYLFSLYQKMQRKNRPVERIYDVLAMRVIVNEVQDCYAALGVIHTLWPPIPGEFDDYIALPKESTLPVAAHRRLGPRRQAARNPDPHRTRCTRWPSSASPPTGATKRAPGRRRDRDYEAKIATCAASMDWRDDVRGCAGVRRESLHSEIFQDRIYVYTPKGEIIELPAGSTPIDFAFHIHTELGYQCGGAHGQRQDRHRWTRRCKTATWCRSSRTARRKGPSRDWITPGRALRHHGHGAPEDPPVVPQAGIARRTSPRAAKSWKPS